MIEMPALLKDLGKLCDTDKIQGLLLERIEAHRKLRVCRSNNNQLVAQVTAQPAFACVNCSQQKWRRITVKVEVDEPTVVFNILHAQIPQERALPAPRFSENCQVHRSLRIAKHNVATRNLIVD